MDIKDDRIYFDGVSAETIAETYGTPTYVYEEKPIRESFRRVLTAFRNEYEDFHLY